MSTAAAVKVETFLNAGGRIKPRRQTTGTDGHFIAKFNFGAFNATTNPGGIRAFTTTDTAVIGVVDANNVANPTGVPLSGAVLKLDSVRFYSNATFTLGTANSVNLKVVRANGTTKCDFVIANITEASGFGTTTMTGVVDIEITLDAGDSLVIVPDGAIDTAADATKFVFVEVGFERLQDGGRLSVGTAA
jgi:hypothetical protein